jgi:F-type H+-transporting ATPase subunit c
MEEQIAQGIIHATEVATMATDVAHQTSSWIDANVAYHLGLGIAALGSGLGLGKAVGSAMDSMGRQPEAAPKIQVAMIIGCAFIEALTIYALVSPFLRV